MLHLHHRRRPRRLATCTALALGAGLAPVGPAAAADALAAATPATTTATAAVRAKPRFDWDGDGRSDRIFRSAATGKTTILLSKTNTSAPFTIGYDEASGTGAKEILPAGDLWGTTAPELLTLTARGGLRLHSAANTTSTAAHLVWEGSGWQIYNKVIAPGDLTGDGHQDLLARTPSGALYLYAAKGGDFDHRGPFLTRVAVGGGWQGYDQIVGTNDLDGDAIADLVARTPKGDLYFHKGTGSATAPFKARVRIGGGWNVYNQVIGTDDLNGDGRGDLLARTYGGAFYQYLSTGGGKFGARTYFGGGGQNLSYYLGQGGVPDFGKHDLFTVDAAGTAFTHGTTANGLLTARKQDGAAGDHAYHWGTVNGHSRDDTDRADLVTATNPGLWSVRGGLIANSGVFNGYFARIVPGDVDGDGVGDLLGQDQWGDLFLHPGVKEFGKPSISDKGVRVGTGWPLDTVIAAGDVTGDGRPDLLSRHDGVQLRVHPGTGSATAPFGAPVAVGKGWQAYAYLASPGDMDGDGRSDLVAVTPGGDVYRYSATGLGGTSVFAGRVKIASGWKYEHVS
ncbi:FG-GAP repeat domain-containing protein [Streptomyces sp. NPDC012825]|uniref:FG-GAP repeat domain-containing protein n=1 Tax=Streptomyces sp. NPDC012825 TaxID=3364851 RepID=UPI0036964BAA